MHKLEAEIASSDSQCTRRARESGSAQATRRMWISDFQSTPIGNSVVVYTHLAM